MTAKKSGFQHNGSKIGSRQRREHCGSIISAGLRYDRISPISSGGRLSSGEAAFRESVVAADAILAVL
jgi:hypothetical protein